MPIDPRIALGIQPVQIDYAQLSPFNQMAKVAQMRQVQQEGELNALKLQEAQAGLEERNKLRALDPNAPDYGAQLMRVSPAQGIAYMKEREAAETAKATRQKTLADAAETKQKMIGQAWRDVSARPSDAQITAHLEDVMASDLFTPTEKAKAKATADLILAMPFEQRGAYLMQQGATAGEMKPTVHVGPSGAFTTPAFGGTATPVAGAEGAFQMTPAQKAANEIARGQLAVSQGQLGVAQGNLALSRNKAEREASPAFQQAMAAAKATGEAIAKGDVAARQALPKIISDAEMAVNLVDQMIGKQEVKDAKTGKVIQKATAPHPGFENAVGAGLGQRFIPGTDAAGFQALQDQVEGTAFLSAFEALRGGGAISDVEGRKATAARMRMSLAQDENSYINAAREFQDVVRKGVEEARRKAGGATPATGAPSTGAKFLGFE